MAQHKNMKNSFLNLFRLYSERLINADILYSQLLAMQEDMGSTIMFKFGADCTILYTVNNIYEDIYGHNSQNRNLINDFFDSVCNGESELTILS